MRKVIISLLTILSTLTAQSETIIHPDGYVITNQHVINENYKGSLWIKFHSIEKGIIKHEVFKKIRVVAVSHRYDLALLKIEGFEKCHFPYVSLATGHKVEKGDEVVAIGVPKVL